MIWAIDVGTRDSEAGERGMEEDDGIVSNRVERATLINEVEGT